MFLAVWGILSDWNLKKKSIIILLWFLNTLAFIIKGVYLVNKHIVNILCHTLCQPSGPSDKGSSPWGFRCLGVDTTRNEEKKKSKTCNCVQVLKKGHNVSETECCFQYV